MSVTVKSFTSVPKRTGGGGGGRKPGENLVAVRGLAEGQMAEISVEVRPDETFQNAAKRVTATFHRKGALDFPIKTLTNPTAGTVSVYRVAPEVETPADAE